jgi:hypothetical protein
MDLHELGSRENPGVVKDLEEGLRLAQNQERKVWVRIRCDYEYLYEVYPGGRNIKWARNVLDALHQRAPFKADEAKSLVDAANWEASGYPLY